MPRFESMLSVPVPPGWIAKESVTLLEPTGNANVIVSNEPLQLETTVEEYARSQGELLQSEFPEYHELAFDPIELADSSTAYLRRFEWTPPEGERIAQIQLYHVHDGRAVTATATTPATTLERFELDFVTLLRGIVLERAASP